MDLLTKKRRRPKNRIKEGLLKVLNVDVILVAI
jgi:hypothetical protein